MLAGQVTDPSAVVGSFSTYRSRDVDLDVYHARPSGDRADLPGLVVIHEAFGMNEHIQDVARRFANLGFVVAAPDLYKRIGAPDPNDLPDVINKMVELPDQQAVADLEAAAAFIRAQPGTSGRVGSIGFCSGGRQSLLFACSSDSLDAAVDCWGGSIASATDDELTTATRPSTVLDLVPLLRCPLFAAVGERDSHPSPAEVRLVEERVPEGGPPVTVKVYRDAGHAFFADYRPTYVEAAAKELWADVVPFLKRWLT
jgi:carboxymethylenebutenolidase